VRADSGFFDGKLLEFLEKRKLSYIVVARLTSSLKRAAAGGGATGGGSTITSRRASSPSASQSRRDCIREHLAPRSKPHLRLTKTSPLDVQSRNPG